MLVLFVVRFVAVFAVIYMQLVKQARKRYVTSAVFIYQLLFKSQRACVLCMLVVEIYLQIDKIFVMTYLIAGCVFFTYVIYLYLVTGISEGRSVGAFTYHRNGTFSNAQEKSVLNCVS